MADPTARPIAISAPPLVGREREQAALRDHLAAALAGGGTLVLIGEEGGNGAGRARAGRSTSPASPTTAWRQARAARPPAPAATVRRYSELRLGGGCHDRSHS